MYPSSEQPTDAFRTVAPFYDELMKGVPYRMWVGYYLLLLSQQDVHPRTMLDVACGTGTMSQMLFDEGFDVTGFDLSEDMIRQAQDKARRKGLPLRFEVADAISFDLGNQFDAAYSFFDCLNNILEPELLQSAFHRVAAHLPPGGSWVFDLNTAYAFEQQMFDQQNLKPKAKLRYKWDGEWDEESQIITVRMRFWRGEQEFEEIHRQRAYDIGDVFDMLEDAGFGEIRAYESYTLNPPRAKSDRLHYTAIRV